MSDPNQPPAPSKQTSSVPLKKETVRVTLKAADAPPAVPSATVPQAPPVKPPMPPTAPKPPTAPPAPSATAPGAPVPPPTAAPRPTAPAPAPTIPLRTAGGTTARPAAAPAPTIKLATSTAPIGGGSPTLPKATVQLTPPTRPLTASASPSQMGTVSMDDEDYEAEESNLVKGLSVAGFVAALIVLGFQIAIANIWVNVEDNPKVGEWSQIIE